MGNRQRSLHVNPPSCGRPNQFTRFTRFTLPGCTCASRFHRLDTNSDPGYLLDRYKGLGCVLRPGACCCATNDAIIRESRTCNRAREVVIFISANAEALCCSIARERLVYKNKQDQNKEDAATHIRHPLPSMLLEERIPRLAIRVFGYQSRCRAHQSKSQTTIVRHPTKAVPAPNEFSLQISVYYKQENLPHFISPCVFCCFAKARSWKSQLPGPCL